MPEYPFLNLAQVAGKRTAVRTMRLTEDVVAERVRQVQKFGVQRHANAGVWLAILGEEFGEVCQAAGPHMGLGTGKPTDAADLYTELIQVAAVAVAWAEQIAEERRGEHGTR